MLDQWILEKISSHKSASTLILRDPQRMIQSGNEAVDGWAEDHGFSVLFCTGNLALREMYETVRDELGLRTLLVDRSRHDARTQLFYPDLDVKAGRRHQMTLTLRDFLVEKTGDAAWPQMVNDRLLSRLLLAQLPGVLRAHAHLRSVRPTGFSDSDLHKVALGAALGVNPFRQLTVDDIRRVSMEHHRTLEEIQRVLPAEAMEVWRKALAKVPKPFCWLLDRDPTLVVRSFTLASILHQHGLDHRLLLSTLDPQLHAYKDIDDAFLEQALREQVAADPDRVIADVQETEKYLLEADGALPLLRDQLQLDDPAQARIVLERETLSPLIRSLALFSLLADLLANNDLKLHRPVCKLLEEQERQIGIPALRRPSENWLGLRSAYDKAITTLELIGRLVKVTKKLKTSTEDELDAETFDRLWNVDGVNRLDYYLSDLERTLRVGAVPPIAQRLFWPELVERWANARSQLAQTVLAANQMQNAVNYAFQQLYLRNYTEWIRRDDAPLVFTHQFLTRLLKAHWDPQGKRKAVIMIFDGMRTDAFQEFLLPVLTERYRVIASRPGSAILPTETHLSRKAIAAGTLPEAFTAKNELDLLRRWLKETWNLNPKFDVLKDDDTVASGMTVRYQSDKLEYIIFNFTDKNLHNNTQDLAFIYDNTVRAIIRQDVRSVLRELPDDALLFVTSDHGFSPTSSKYFKIETDWVAAHDDVKYRVARTRKQIPETARSSVAHFDARMMGIPLNSEFAPTSTIHSVIFPRPGQTFQRANSSRAPDPYTHGGLSMAECFVPMVVLGPPDAQQPLLRIERFVQTGSVREGETLTLELTLVPMRIAEGEQLLTLAFSASEIGQRREVFSGSETTYTLAWTPNLGEIGEAERASGEIRLPVTAIVTYQEGEKTVRLSRTQDARIKLDTTRLRRRVDSKLDLLMGKVPKGLQG